MKYKKLKGTHSTDAPTGRPLNDLPTNCESSDMRSESCDEPLIEDGLPGEREERKDLKLSITNSTCNKTATSTTNRAPYTSTSASIRALLSERLTIPNPVDRNHGNSEISHETVGKCASHQLTEQDRAMPTSLEYATSLISWSLEKNNHCGPPYYSLLSSCDSSSLYPDLLTAALSKPFRQ